MPQGLSFKKIGVLDPAPLLARLAAHPELWRAGPREKFKGSPHAQAESILVRWVAQDPETKFFPTSPDSPEPLAQSFMGSDGHRTAVGEVHAIRQQEVQGATTSVDYPAGALLMPEIGNAMMEVLEPLGAIGELGHVMLTKLPPGGRIEPHTDEGLYSDLFDRFHVCLAGGAANIFQCGSEAFSPEPGDVFWFNHKRRHSVQNHDAIHDRIHLIVDVMAPHFTALRGVYYQQESEGDLKEAGELLRAHYLEVAHFKDIPMEIDETLYARAEAAGELRRFAVRDAGKLVGYCLFFVRPNHHYRGSLQAWQDIFYIDPAYRKSMVPARLIRHAEERLKAEGVQVVYHHAKRTNQMGELVARLGYDLVDEIYAKRLDKGRQ